MGVLASQAPYGLGATTVALVRRGQPLTAEAHGECTDPTAHGCSVRHDQGADCSMRGTKGQAAEPACFLLDFKDFLLSRNGKDLHGIQCGRCGLAAVCGRRGGKRGGHVEWCCKEHLDRLPAEARSAASIGYFSVHPSWADWLKRREERVRQLKEEREAAEQEQRKHFQKLQELHNTFIQEALAPARNILAWAACAPLRESLEETFQKDCGQSMENIQVSVKQVLSRAVIEMLLLRGNVEANPGPSLPEEQARVDGFVEDDLESEDEPLIRRATVNDPARCTQARPWPTPELPTWQTGCVRSRNRRDGQRGRAGASGSPSQDGGQERTGGVDISPSTANFNGGERTAAELPTQPAAASPAAPPLAGAAVPPQPESTAGNGLAQRSNRSAGGRGRGRGSGPRRQASSRKQGAGRKSGTSVLDAALARPSEGSSDQPGSEGVANAQNGDGVETEAIPERAAQNPESVHEETEERAQARHVADARWNAAIKKDGSLRPKSKKDYIRGLKTYKHFCTQHGYGKDDGEWAPARSAAVLKKLGGSTLPLWASGPRITVDRIALAVDLVEKLNDQDEMSISIVQNFCKSLQFYAIVQDFLEGVHTSSMDVRAIHSMQELLKSAAGNTANKKIRACADRQEGTESDGYTEEEKLRLAQAWLQRGRRSMPGVHGDDDGEDGDIHQHTTMRGMFLTSHQFCLRGDDARSIDLPDLYSKRYQHVGPDVPLYVGGVSYSGKTNKNGRLEYFGGIRHMQVEQCAVGAVAMQLFQTFHLLGAGVPDFSNRESWYNLLPLFYEGDDVSRNVTYNTQLKHFKHAYREQEIVSSKLTHAPRGASVRHAEDNGGKEAESARLGRWIYDHFRTSYLHQLPVGIMLVQAGFKDDRKGYCLPRGRVHPLEDEYPGLAKQIFPWADEELRKVKQRNLTGPASQRDIAAQKFLELLIELRAVLLQDVALLQRMGKYEDHSIIHHHFFEGEEWDKFCDAVEAVCNAPAPPPELANIPPEVVAVLQDQQVQLARIERESQASREREQALMGQMSVVVRVLERLVSVFPSGDEQARSRATSARPAAQSPTAPQPRRTATGFFARPPSAPVAAAVEAALRAAAEAAQAAERATRPDRHERGQGSDEGRSPEAETGDRVADTVDVEHLSPGVGSCDQSSSAPVAAATEAALKAAAEAAQAAATARAAADAAATQNPDAPSGEADDEARVPTAAGEPPETAEKIAELETGLHEGLEFLASEQANGSPGGAVTTQESDMETEEATREGRRLPPSREEGAHECRDIPEGPHEGERELSEACEESGTTSQPCLVPRSNSGVTVSGSDSAAGSRAADPVTEEDASVVPEWALNYLVNRNYTSVADVWKEWAHGQDGYPISLRRMEELWGTRWRRGRLNEGKRISKFRKLTRMVESVIEQHDGISEAAAVQAVENTMVASGVDADQPWKYCELLQESQAGNPNEPSEEPSKQSGKRRTSQESGSKKKRQKAVA